jgi:hypothetical protein
MAAIPLGWWLLPAAITLACAVWCAIPRPNEKQRDDDFDITRWAPGAFRLAMSLAAGLGSWLVWGLAQ